METAQVLVIVFWVELVFSAIVIATIIDYAIRALIRVIRRR